MWKDGNDQIEELYVNIKKIEKFPAKCPVCNKNDAHIYMHVYNDKTRRGGLWIWCSECYTFSHSSIYVPEYWKNCPLVEEEELCAIPAYLNEIREIVDAHVNVINNYHLGKDK